MTQKSNLDVAQIWEEYGDMQKYLTENGVYDNIKKNEKFVEGNQWDGCETETIAKITMNELKRIRDYQCASIASNDIGISINPMSVAGDIKDKSSFISTEIKKVMEQTGMIKDGRLVVNDAYAAGYEYFLHSFDPDYDTGQIYKGRIKNQIVDATQVGFGNPYDSNIQEQPYILIALRQYVETVRDEARDLGIDEDTVESITTDSDDSNMYEEKDNKLCTVLLRFYKKRVWNEALQKYVRTVHYCKCTKNVVLIDETDLGYYRYPITCFGWIPKKRSYIYESPVTANIPAQIFINKLFTVANEYAIKGAFPKPIVDKNKIDPKKLLDGTGNALVTANADLLGKFVDFYKSPDFSGQVLNLINLTISELRETMGVNDTVLGNIRPDNAQAILATSEITVTPLKIQLQAWYDFWEDNVRNLIDIMTTCYGVREAIINGEKGEIDWNALKGINFDLDIDTGTAAQFSEITQFSTISNLLSGGYIDLDEFTELVNNKVVPKAALQEVLKKRSQNPNIPTEVTQ